MKCSKNFLVDGCVVCGLQKTQWPTPADDMAAQIITDCGNFTLDFKQHGFCASPLFIQTLGLCCLCTFSYPNSSFQSTLHLICFDTALCKQPHLSVMTFCDLPSLWRVSMFIFWIIAKSAVFPIIVVSKNKRYPEFILYGWSFIETQM